MLDRTDVAEIDTSPFVEFQDRALVFAPDTPYEVWTEVLSRLLQAEKSIRWWIGDAIRFGESAYGEKYSQAIEATGYAYQTVANSVYVANKYPDPSFRKENHTFRQHEIVAPLEPEEREEILDRSYQMGWTERQLLEEVRERRVETPGVATGEIVVMEDCPHCEGRGKRPVEVSDG